MHCDGIGIDKVFGKVMWHEGERPWDKACQEVFHVHSALETLEVGEDYSGRSDLIIQNIE